MPTVIFNEKVSPVGAVPEEHYRLLLDWMLAGEPGGLLAPPVEDKRATLSSRGAAKVLVVIRSMVRHSPID